MVDEKPRIRLPLPSRAGTREHWIARTGAQLVCWRVPLVVYVAEIPAPYLSSLLVGVLIPEIFGSLGLTLPSLAIDLVIFRMLFEHPCHIRPVWDAWSQMAGNSCKKRKILFRVDCPAPVHDLAAGPADICPADIRFALHPGSDVLTIKGVVR